MRGPMTSLPRKRLTSSAPVIPPAPQPVPRPVEIASAGGTVAAILRAAGEVLDQVGYEGLNTTTIAHRAEVGTATLYRHFADKHAVLHALVLQLQGERAATIGKIYEALATAPDWRQPAAEATWTAYRLRRSRPGGRASRRALQSSPELWAWDRAQNEEMAANLARAMRVRKPKLAPKAALRIALVAISMSAAMLDLALSYGDDVQAEALVAETVKAREAYLARYLD